MKENKLVELSMDFSVDIINLVKYLKSNHETVISNQIGRSGTSIGANIHEAQYAQGTKNFISKFEIALKEASETGYWLEMLWRSKYIDEARHKTLDKNCSTIRFLLVCSIQTAKMQIKMINIFSKEKSYAKQNHSKEKFDIDHLCHCFACLLGCGVDVWQQR